MGIEWLFGKKNSKKKIPVSTPSKPVLPSFKTPLGCGVHTPELAEVDALTNIGFKYARYPIYMHSWTNDQFKVIRHIGNLTNNNITPLLVIAGIPSEALLEDFTDFCVLIAKMFPFCDIQLGNEVDAGFPGMGLFFGNNVLDRVLKYTDMLDKTVPRIRDYSYGQIVTSGVALMDEDLKDWFVVLSDAPRDIDAIHTYGLPILTNFIPKAQNAKRLSTKPIWCTEIGLSAMSENGETFGGVWPPGWDRSSHNIDETQKNNIVDCITTNDNLQLCQRIYIHTLKQNGDLGYDIIRQDGSLRPTAQWLKTRLNP